MKQITRLSPDQLQRLKSLVDEAMLQQSLRNARNRNRIARLVFSNPKWRWVALWETGTVRTWWDPRTRNYITAIRGEMGEELGQDFEDECSDCSDSAAIRHLWFLNHLINRMGE